MPKIIIIGGGIAGLSAGIYARKCGFECEIHEKHFKVGGECTGWERKGYHIDNCVHWMTGTSPSSDIHETWCKVHALGKDVEIIQNPSFLSVEYNGQKLELWQDLNRLRQDMLTISPEDAKEIEKFVANIKLYQSVILPANKPLEQYSIWELFSLIKSMFAVGRIHKEYSRMSMRTYSQKFKHPLLQKMILSYMPKTYNISSFFYVLGTFSSGNGALPKGGSTGITDRMSALYTELGGKTFCKKEAVSIDIDKFKAKRVIFKDGTTAEGDFIICACDASVVFEKLLGKKHLDKYFKLHFFHKHKHPVYSSFNAYIGVNDSKLRMSDTTWFEGKKFDVCNKKCNSFLLKYYGTEPNFSPEGKSLLQALLVQYEDDFEYWKSLYTNNIDAYKQAKLRIAQSIISNIEEHYPELKGKLEIIETVTPMSFNRLCGAYKGAYMSFILTPFAKKKIHKGHLRYIKNVYLAGQWLQPPGGLPNAVVTGKFVIQRICKKEGLKFVQ
ncbi:MAG: NAD(P)/FAD-dependent oxidoreductase [Bacteroidia bacterium]|nr:NAD(P)/FAD-dependent oxidoreductase [Bacteroidia bacterium]